MAFIIEPVTFLFPRINRTIVPNGDLPTIDINVVINERTEDALTITSQPVQQGAAITDHSFKEPTVLTMTAYLQDNSFDVSGFLSGSQSGLSKLYGQLLKLQSDRQPFDIITPKRYYSSMLLKSLGLTTDKNTENTLAVTMSFQEVILVSISTTLVPRSRQRNAGATGRTEQAGRKSALASLKEGVGALAR